jgi:hypothetical protein
MEWNRSAQGICGMVVVAFFLLSSTLWAGEALPEYPVKGMVVNELHLFDNPEAVIFSMDGRYLFVANSAVHGDASKPFGFVEGAGSISKLEVGPRGDLKVIDLHFIDDITAPLGMAVLPINTKKFTRGTIFAPVGSAPLAESDGTPIVDPARLKTKIIAFNPDSGRILGEINLAAGSEMEKVTGGPVVLANALAFDGKGNLYVTDSGFGADQFSPPIAYHGGTWKIAADSLDALAEGKSPSSPVQFIPNPGWPDGVEVSPVTGEIWVNTVGGDKLDPAHGGIWRLTDDDFAKGVSPAPVFKNLGRLDGLDFTARGTQINTEILNTPNSIIVIPPGGNPARLVLEPAVTLSGPADVVIKPLQDGSHLLVVPELTALDPTPWNDDVTVIWVPSTFDGSPH